jgi:hypothetical protein
LRAEAEAEVDRTAVAWGQATQHAVFGTLGVSIALPILVYIVRDLGGAAWTYGLAAPG